MKKNILLLFLFVLPCLPIGITAQTVHYGYDASGNRISRTIILTSSQAPKAEMNDSAEQSPVLDAVGDVQLAIYPNPTKGMLAVEVQNAADVIDGEIIVYSIQGKFIRKVKMTSTTTNVDLGTCPTGSYLMKITVNNQTNTWTIIKQ